MTGDPGGVREEGGKEARCWGRLGLIRGYFLRDQKLLADPGNASNSNPKSLKFVSEMPKISQRSLEFTIENQLFELHGASGKPGSRWAGMSWCSTGIYYRKLVMLY